MVSLQEAQAQVNQANANLDTQQASLPKVTAQQLFLSQNPLSAQQFRQQVSQAQKQISQNREAVKSYQSEINKVQQEADLEQQQYNQQVQEQNKAQADWNQGYNLGLENKGIPGMTGQVLKGYQAGRSEQKYQSAVTAQKLSKPQEEYQRMQEGNWESLKATLAPQLKEGKIDVSFSPNTITIIEKLQPPVVKPTTFLDKIKNIGIKIEEFEHQAKQKIVEPFYRETPIDVVFGEQPIGSTQGTLILRGPTLEQASKLQRANIYGDALSGILTKKLIDSPTVDADIIAGTILSSIIIPTQLKSASFLNPKIVSTIKMPVVQDIWRPVVKEIKVPLDYSKLELASKSLNPEAVNIAPKSIKGVEQFNVVKEGELTSMGWTDLTGQASEVKSGLIIQSDRPINRVLRKLGFNIEPTTIRISRPVDIEKTFTGLGTVANTGDEALSNIRGSLKVEKIKYDVPYTDILGRQRTISTRGGQTITIDVDTSLEKLGTINKQEVITPKGSYDKMLSDFRETLPEGLKGYFDKLKKGDRIYWASQVKAGSGTYAEIGGTRVSTKFIDMPDKGYFEMRGLLKPATPTDIAWETLAKKSTFNTKYTQVPPKDIWGGIRREVNVFNKAGSQETAYQQLTSSELQGRITGAKTSDLKMSNFKDLNINPSDEALTIERYKQQDISKSLTYKKPGVEGGNSNVNVFSREPNTILTLDEDKGVMVVEDLKAGFRYEKPFDVTTKKVDIPKPVEKPFDFNNVGKDYWKNVKKDFQDVYGTKPSVKVKELPIPEGWTKEDLEILGDALNPRRGQTLEQVNKVVNKPKLDTSGLVSGTENILGTPRISNTLNSQSVKELGGLKIEGESIYTGTGAYEVNMGLSPMGRKLFISTKNDNLNLGSIESQSNLIRVENMLRIGNINKLIPDLKINQDTTSRLDNSLRVDTNVVQDLNTNLKLDQKLNQNLKLDQKLNQAQVQNKAVLINQTPIPTRNKTPTRMDFGFPDSSKLKKIKTNNKTKGKGIFTAQVRRRGKFLDVGTSPTPQGALEIGKAVARKTLGASLRVKQGEKLLQLNPQQEFRKSRNIKDPFSLVQISVSRLSSQGERREIKQSRRGGFKWL